MSQKILSNRPIHHPNQVMSTSELKIGDKITWNNVYYGQMKPETIISFGYYPLAGKLQRCFRTITSTRFIKENFFTDYGIEPYKGTYWNASNYTLKVKD